MSEAKLSIVLAEDHHVVRQALRMLLQTEPGFEVIGETSDGLAVAELAARLEPDVLVLDLVMPGLGGVEIARQITKRGGKTRVLILSMHMNEAHVLEALRAGVHGYVRKDATAPDLIRAIREVAAGRLYFSAPFSGEAIDAYRRRAAEAEADPHDQLTAREREVLHLAAEGLGNAEAARRLGISPRTVEIHRARMMRKLGFRRLADLVRYAARRGLVPLDGEHAG
jgi:DNA-binding NarL/FixJ family response regulator